MLTVNKLWATPTPFSWETTSCGCSALMTAKPEVACYGDIRSGPNRNLRGAIAEHVARLQEEPRGLLSQPSAGRQPLLLPLQSTRGRVEQSKKKAVRAAKCYGYSLGMAFQTIATSTTSPANGPRGNYSTCIPPSGSNPRISGCEVLDKDPATGLDLVVELVEDSSGWRLRSFAAGFCSGHAPASRSY